MYFEKLHPKISVIEACMGTIQRAKVGVISTGLGPQTSPRLLIHTCQGTGFISNCPEDGWGGCFCKGYLTPHRWPGVLTNKPLTSRVSTAREGGRLNERKSETGVSSPQGKVTPGASLFCRILGVDLPLTSSVIWGRLTGDSCSLWWNSRFHQKEGRKDGGVWWPLWRKMRHPAEKC